VPKGYYRDSINRPTTIIVVGFFFPEKQPIHELQAGMYLFKLSVGKLKESVTFTVQ
jgi:hypothetical protein